MTAVLCVLASMGWAQTPLYFGDFNRDGKITAEDVAKLVDIAVGHGVPQVVLQDQVLDEVKAESLTLDKSELTVPQGDERLLQATLLPAATSNKEVVWTSADETVATVADGVVKALGQGSTEVKAMAADGSEVYATCVVTVGEPVDHFNGHEYVDLGIRIDGKKILWATTNIGAAKMADYGDYIAWGELAAKTDYSNEKYAYYKYFKAESATTDADGLKVTGKAAGYRWIDLGEDIAGTEYDAARAALGGDWRMPTKAEMKALMTQCTWTWGQMKDSQNAMIYGYKVEGNGNFIFLPATGYRYGSNFWSNAPSGKIVVITGCYWCSTDEPDFESYAQSMTFDSASRNGDFSLRSRGLAVRAVCAVDE